jgi:DNA polymerase II large subunit
VLKAETEQKAKEIRKEIEEVLYLGDVLVNYGGFLNSNHMLVPPGYCEEWWAQELEKKIVSIFGSLDVFKLAEIVNTKPEILEKVLKSPLKKRPDPDTAFKIAKATDTPLHPHYTYFWNSLKKEELPALAAWLHKMKIENDEEGVKKAVLAVDKEQKRKLELLGVPHTLASNEFVVFSKGDTIILKEILKIGSEDPEQAEAKLKELAADDGVKETVDLLNRFSDVKQRDKCGIFIGGRMGRPEKAKMRKLTGSPHVLFPVGEEGGRMRSFQSALEKGQINAEFATYKCEHCGNESVLPVCSACDKKANRQYHCRMCGPIETKECPKHGKTAAYVRRQINIKHYFSNFLKKLKTKTYPDLIKGVRGTSNREHIPEHLMKGILRAKHDVCVNKEGTVRYDCSELPLTHFKPEEIGVSVEKLKELGYEKDIKGRLIESKSQTLELKPQDIVIPCCPDSPDEPSDKILTRTARFVDEELEQLYGLKPYYNIKSRDDLAGKIIIGLEPHTSAGTVGRIIGFSKTQGFLAHPLMHAAMRRDCDGDESCIILLLDAFINFSRKYLPDSRGSTMDAPLVLTSVLTPSEVDDMVFDVDRVWIYPLEFYEACLEYKNPWEVKLDTIKNVLATEKQYEGMGFTHDTENINAGVLCSAYKTLPSMQDKLLEQMKLAEKLRAVDESDVARLVIEKHFIRDIKGNLRKFSQQEFRCVNCNEKYRRPPLLGKCTACGGKIIFTISEGSIIKYLEPSISLANKYELPNFLKQSLELTKRRIEGVFGKEKEKQEGLGKWFG